jgi:intracellular multiplication protein IcmW
MSALSHQEVHRFWSDFKDPTIYKVICTMESAEDWTIDDDPDVEKALQDLSETLDQLGSIELKNESTFVDIVSQIKTGRGLRLLMCLDMAYPGAAAKVIMHAEKEKENGDKNAQFFLRRNIVFERLRLLGRVFSQERLKLVTQALEGGYE